MIPYILVGLAFTFGWLLVSMDQELNEILKV